MHKVFDASLYRKVPFAEIPEQGPAERAAVSRELVHVAWGSPAYDVPRARRPCHDSTAVGSAVDKCSHILPVSSILVEGCSISRNLSMNIC